MNDEIDNDIDNYDYDDDGDDDDDDDDHGDNGDDRSDGCIRWEFATSTSRSGGKRRRPSRMRRTTSRPPSRQAEQGVATRKGRIEACVGRGAPTCGR